jgi:hypothetical protein
MLLLFYSHIKAKQNPRFLCVDHWSQRLTLSVCWVISLENQFIQEAFYSIWSMSRYVDDPTFFISLYLFVWAGGKDATFTQMNNSQAFVYLRQMHPSVPIVVREFNRSWIPSISEEIFPSKYPIVVASRIALPLVLDSDFVMYMDADTHVLQNPFPDLKREFRRLSKAVLMGVHDVAAGGDQAFIGPMKQYNITWELYQQAALYVFRNGPTLHKALRQFFAEWSTHTEVFRFPEQDAVGIYFPLSLKGILADSFLRQWGDCNISKHHYNKIICHGRWGDMTPMQKIVLKEMMNVGIKYDFSIDPENRLSPCCAGL